MCIERDLNKLLAVRIGILEIEPAVSDPQLIPDGAGRNGTTSENAAPVRRKEGL